MFFYLKKLNHYRQINLLWKFSLIKLVFFYKVRRRNWAVNKNDGAHGQIVVITWTMSLNVPDSNEEVHDKNIGAVSVPFNGVPKVKKRQILKNEEYNEWCCRYWKSRNSVWRMIWSVRLLKWKLDGEYETKSFQDYNDGEFVCINIRGKKFIVLRENFERFPDTRLGKLVVKCCNFQLMVLVVGQVSNNSAEVEVLPQILWERHTGILLRHVG